jgi:two-component system OmpR family response regulator
MTPSENDPAARPVFETDLTQTPLPEILVTVYRYKAPGTVECRRGNELKEIYLDRGHIVFATSNQVRDSLGDRLLNEGVITRGQYDESVRRLLSGGGKRQGMILTEMQVLSSEAMLEAVRQQIQAIVWSLFAWDGGTARFVPGRDRHSEFVKLDIPIPQAVIEGVRHSPDAKMLLGRIGGRTTVLAPTGKEIAELQLDENEQHLLESVDGKRPLGDLVNTAPLASGVNARLLYAFFVMGMIEVKQSTPIRVKVQTNAAGRPTQ